MQYKITYTDPTGHYHEQQTSGVCKACDLQQELIAGVCEDVELHGNEVSE